MMNRLEMYPTVSAVKQCSVGGMAGFVGLLRYVELKRG